MKRLLAAVFIICCTLRASDEDKEHLFNTFYLEGETATYVLTLHADREFDLYGPNQEHLSGKFRVDEKHISLASGDVKRMFVYDEKGIDLKLEPRDGDHVVRGNVLGEMPPQRKGHVIYLAESTWRKKGRALLALSKVHEVAPAATERVVPQPAAPLPTDAAPFADITGAYFLPGEKSGRDLLKIADDGLFEYLKADGTKQRGTLQRTGNELTFVSASYKRNFTFRLGAAGLELTRRETDIIKASDPLGAMAPQDRNPLTWLADPETRARTVAANPAPATPAPATTAPVAPPPPAVAAVAAKSLKEVAGTYAHRPNPFITETLTLGEDGTFTYSDSNGSNATGSAKFENDLLILTSDVVVRQFTATMSGATLTLTRTTGDTPKLRNDLATMSPTTLKSAKYDPKK